MCFEGKIINYGFLICLFYNSLVRKTMIKLMTNINTVAKLYLQYLSVLIIEYEILEKRYLSILNVLLEGTQPNKFMSDSCDIPMIFNWNSPYYKILSPLARIYNLFEQYIYFSNHDNIFRLFLLFNLSLSFCVLILQYFH